jgi:hypothetical protein
MPSSEEVYEVPSIFDPTEHYDSQTSPGKYRWRYKFIKKYHLVNYFFLI